MLGKGKNASTTKEKSKNPVTNTKQDISNSISITSKFALLNRLITRDLNNDTTSLTFYKYTKDQIAEYLKDPSRNEKSLRNAIVYIYGASSHFRRIIQYFTALSDYAYVVSPYKIDPSSANPRSINRNYRRVLNLMASMNAKTQLSKIVSVCLREDTFYGTLWITNDNITIQRLPSDYCAISAIEGNVPNVSFDFSYFTAKPQNLDFYPNEFKTKYELYKKNSKQRWQELDSPTSFAIKCNSDILEYSLPPFAGILREVYDLEDYRELKLTKTALENYAMLVMSLGIDDDGEWQMDLNQAKEFWQNLDAVLPEEVGSVLSPMPITKIDFDKSNTGDTNTIADAEQNLFTAAGVSSLLFNNDKASANALMLSIKADQQLTYGIVKNIEDALNRYIQSLPYGKNFKVTFLDCSIFNRKELGDMYIKACQCGMPMVSYYCASQGLSQSEMDSMNFLENDVLKIKSNFIPLKNSSQMSSNDLDSKSSSEGGAPAKDPEDITESGEQNQEDA